MKDNNNGNTNQTSKPMPINNAAKLTSLCVDISPSSSNFFEVLYIGKIKVWRKKVPDTFVDDALEKFKEHDLEKKAKKLQRLRSEAMFRRGSLVSTLIHQLNSASTFTHFSRLRNRACFYLSTGQILSAIQRSFWMISEYLISMLQLRIF